MSHPRRALEDMGRTYNPAIGVSFRSEAHRVQRVAQGLRAGTGPVCHRFLVENVPPTEAGVVLDFGCGVGSTTGAVHVQALRRLGYACDGYEWVPAPADASARTAKFWELEQEGIVRTDACDFVWDTVLVSNVLNVQPTKAELAATLAEIQGCLGPAALLLINLPKEPRHLQAPGRAGERQTTKLLAGHFEHVAEVEPGLWACYGTRG